MTPRPVVRPSRATVLAASYLTVVAAALCAVPLFDLLAYEFCLAMGFAQVPASLFVGHRAACRVGPQPGVATWWAARDITLALLPPLGLVLGNALRVRNCNVGHGLVLYAALPWASACYGSVVACTATTLLRRTMPRPARARPEKIMLAALGLAPLGYSLARLYWQPPIAAYDHLWGYFAGSIYDEQVALTPAFWAFRAATAGRILAAVACCAFAARAVVSRRRVWAAALGACVFVVGVDAAVGPRAGYRVDRAQLRRVLPQERHCRGVVLHLPASLDASDATRLARDHAFRLAQAKRRLQLGEEARPVHSWVFADADAKARWTGGRNTMVAKPWLGEIYLHGTATPHPLVAHELVHALLGPYGERPFGVPRQQGVGVNVGLVEGMAEAVAFADRSLTAEEVTSCLWSTGGATLLEAAMGGRLGAGAPPFWAQPGPRAYAASGAFVGYLSRRFGPAALLQIYGGAPWEAATGAPLPALVADFAAALTQAPPHAATCARARASYARPSVFGRVCAHEIATLKTAQRDASPTAGLALQRRIAAFLPGDWREQIALATRLLATDAPADAAEAAQILAATPAQNPPAAAAVHEAVAGALARTGRLSEAASQLRAGLALPCDPPLARALFVRQWSLGQAPALREATDALLAGRCEPWRCAALLAQAAAGNDATASYLLGRQLFVRGQLAQASAALSAAGPHPFVPIEAERQRLLALAAWRARTDDCGAGSSADADALNDLLAHLEAPLMPADAHRFAADLRERITFEKEGAKGT